MQLMHHTVQMDENVHFRELFRDLGQVTVLLWLKTAYLPGLGSPAFHDDGPSVPNRSNLLHHE